MPITYPLTPPSTPGFSAVRFTPRSVVAVAQSPFTGSQQVQRHEGQWFEAECTLVPMLRRNAEPWIAFMLSLNGRQGTFLLGDPAGVNPRGTISGTPIVNGAHAVRSATLAISGLTVGTTLLAGDYVQLGAGATARIHKNLVDVTADATGSATLDLWPALRTGLSSGAAVITTNARGVFRLVSNEVPFDLSIGSLYGMTFGVIEAL